MDSLTATAVSLYALVLVRGAVTYTLGCRRLREIRDRHLAELDAGIVPDLNEYSHVTDRFYVFVFDLRKWTYKQFFPNS